MFLKFFSFTFVKIEQYFRPRPLEYCGPEWKQPAIKWAEDEHDGNGEILYKTPAKWRWRLLKTSFLCSKNVFFSVKTFHPFNDRSSLGFQSLPDMSRKSVTNEIFQELCIITSILLVSIIGDPYFLNHESLTFLTIYKNMMKWKNSHHKKLSFFNIFFPRAIEFR